MGMIRAGFLVGRGWMRMSVVVVGLYGCGTGRGGRAMVGSMEVERESCEFVGWGMWVELWFRYGVLAL